MRGRVLLAAIGWLQPVLAERSRDRRMRELGIALGNITQPIDLIRLCKIGRGVSLSVSLLLINVMEGFGGRRAIYV
jgi:hypothetical protein